MPMPAWRNWRKPRRRVQGGWSPCPTLPASARRCMTPMPRGVLCGLTLSHTRGDVYRALLESTGYGIRHNIDALRAEGVTPTRILAVGGGTLNLAWMQMVSDIAGIVQHIPAQQIGASYGDAFLAGIGAGLFASTAQADAWVKLQTTVRPDPAAQATYDPYYAVYRDLYPQTMESMHRLSRIEQRRA